MNFHKKLWNKTSKYYKYWMEIGKYEDWKFGSLEKLKFILDVIQFFCKKNIYTYQVSGYILSCNVYEDLQQDQHRFPAGFKQHFEFSQNFLAYVTYGKEKQSSPALLEHKLPLRLLKHSTLHIPKFLPPSSMNWIIKSSTSFSLLYSTLSLF